MQRTLALFLSILMVASIGVAPVLGSTSSDTAVHSPVPSIDGTEPVQTAANASSDSDTETAVQANTVGTDTAGSGTLELGGRGWAETGDSGVSGYPLDIGNQNFVMEFWIKYNETSDEDAVVLTKGGTPGGNDGNYMVYLEGTGDERHVQFVFNDFFNNLQSDGSIPAGQWTHVAFTYDGSTQTIYINGQQDTQASESGGPDSNDNPFLIGVDSAKSGHFLKGEVEDVRIWSTFRNVIEIEDNYLTDLSGSESGLAGLWQFDGDLSDSTGSNDLGTNGDAQLTSIEANLIPPFLYTSPQDDEVVLNWTERLGPSGQNSASEFKIYRDGSEIANVSGTSYVDSSVSNAQTYTYQIRAVDSNGDVGGYSKEVVETPYRERGGSSLNLDGRGWAQATDRDSLDLAENGQSFAIEFWINYNASSDQNAVVLTKGGIPGSSDGNYMAYLQGSGENRQVTFTFDDFTNDLTSDSGIQAGQWTHVLFTWDGSQQTLYINGEQDAQASEGGSSDTNSADFIVGTDDAKTGHFLNGSVDDLRIWKGHRQQSEVRGNWYYRLTGDESDLSNYWRFNDLSAADETRSAETTHGDLQLEGDAKIQAGGAYPVAPHVFAISGNAEVGGFNAEVAYENRSTQSIDELVQYTVPSGDNPTSVIGSALSFGFFDPLYSPPPLNNGQTYDYYITSIVDGQESDFPRAATATPYNESGGSALSLESDEYATVSERESLNLAENGRTFTIEFWVKYKKGSDEDAVVLSKGGTPGSSAGNYMAYLQGTGEDRQVTFTFDDFTNDLTSDSGIQAGQWTHVAFTWDGSQQTLYINGKKDAQASEGGSSDINSAPLQFGTDQPATGHDLQGQVDEVRLWKTSRTTQEIQNNYRSELVGSESELAAYWRFDDAGAASAQSSDTQHQTAELKDGASLAAPGVFPVPPRSYARGDDTEVTTTWQTRTNTTTVNLYRSSQRNRGDRSQITGISAKTQGVYTDTGLQNGATKYYQATAVNPDNQESDFAFPAGALPASQPAGNAFEFDGQSSYLTVEKGESIELGENGQPFTIEFWLKFNQNAPEDAVVLSRGGVPGQSAGNYMAILEGTGANRTVQFQFNDFVADPSSNTAIQAGQWTHVAFTWDGNQQTIYINGQQDAQNSENGSPTANIDSKLRIGADQPATGHYYQGQIDEVRLWRTARSSQKIDSTYERQLVGDEPGLVGYWRGCHTGHTDKVWGQARKPMTATFNNINCVDSGVGLQSGGITSSIDITIDGAPNGLQRYNVTINNTGGEPIRTVTPDLISGSEYQTAAGGPGSQSITARAVDVTNSVSSFSGTRTLLTLEYAGNVTESDLSITVNSLLDDSSASMAASKIGFKKTGGGGGGNPFSGPVPGSGGAGPPTNLDNDPQLEDVNGDGQGTFDDAVALAFVQTGNLNQQQIDALDFDGDGDVDFDDAVSLAFDPALI